MSQDKSLTVWSASDNVTIPAKASPSTMLEYAKSQLSTRDMRSILSAIQTESYEMMATFVWSKAAAVLKKQLSSLGMEFVGEMLRRPDLTEDSDPATSVADHEAIALAEDLGIITSTQAMRLKHALDLVAHFSNLDLEDAEQEMMQPEEALGLLRTCISSILGKPSFDAAIRFAEFRKTLSERTLDKDDGNIAALLGSPYFFRRTTLSVLMTLTKGSKGASTEHALGNTTLLVPLMWLELRDPEKWQVGQVYAEVTADGNRDAATALKKTLLKVHGFDYVPETLRSSTFTEAAARVLDAHFAFNNFHNEESPMSALARLGTAIPKPAFSKTLEAAVAVYTGNPYGVSNAAVPHARSLLDSLNLQQWEYYLNECVRRDRTLLDKLALHERPIKRWKLLVDTYNLHTVGVTDNDVRELIEATDRDATATVKKVARDLRRAVAS
jgi:hypothetical protein